MEDEILADVQHFVEAMADVERVVGQAQHVVGVGLHRAGEVDPLQRRLRHVRARAGDDDLRRPGADVDAHLIGRNQAGHIDPVFGISGADGRPPQGVAAATGGQHDRAPEIPGIDRVDAGAAAQLGGVDAAQAVGLAGADLQAGRGQHHVGVALLDQRVDATGPA